MTTLRTFVLFGAVCLRRFLPRALLLGSLTACCLGARAASVAFNYTLPAASITSAGAYRTDGTLVRTLWNNEPRPAGATTTAWDGLDDSGHPVAPGAYQIKVLAHNVTYTWEGYIGNTSTQQTGPTTQRSFLTIRGMAIAGGAMFPVYGYNEKRPLWSRLSTSDPNSVAVWGTEDFTRKSLAATTDGVLVYYTFSSSSSIASQPSFVAAYKVSDNSAHLFANGVPAPQLGTSPTKFPNVIDLQSGSVNVPSGIAVQPAGAYLFVAHREQNLVRVFNKTSGAAVGSFAVTAPTGLVATADGDVWAICTEGGARVVRRHDVDGAGALAASTAVLAGLSNPLALAVSPDNTTLLVADGGTSQQVKAFANASSGTPAASWTLGLAGGYNAVNGPDIVAGKFSFLQNWWNDTVPDSWWDDGFIEATWLAYQPDGSFWVSDPGNERHLHFSAARAYLGQIAYPTVNYVATVCDAAPTRVFAKGWLEYAVDYSQTARSGWTFVKNWSSGLPDNLARVNRGGFRSVVVLAGRTYGVVHNSTTGKRAVLELPASGIARQTGIEFDATRTMHEDGSLRWQVFSANRTTIYKQDFAGLDGSGNPTWGAAAVLATTPLREMDPADSRVLAPVGPRFPTTSSNVVISNNTTSGWVYHLGGIKAGDDAWAWRAAPPGWYYDGHGVVGVSVYPVNTQFVKGRNILFGCHGEFYSGGQANQFMHFWDNGLLVGQFGSPGFGNPLNSVVAGVTGNAFSPYLTQANGVLYAWVNDEWGTGMHRWRIDNTASIAELTPINVTIGATGGNGSGLTGQYFTGTNLGTLAATRTDPTVNFTWSGAPLSGVPTDNFSVRWSGLVQPLHSEAYTFYTQSDDGVRLWVDGQKVIDNWTSHSSVENASAPIALSAGGLHRVVVEFYDGTGGAVAQLKWSSASQAKQVIPMQQLYPSGTQAYNCGGPAVGRFQEDINGTAGSAMVSTANAIDVSGAADPAPMAVYQRQRKFATEYAFFDLKPFANHRVRLHVAEIVPASFAAGARVFPVGVNELGQIAPSVDPYALAGGAGYKAAVREFVATADNTGVIRVDFPSNTYSLLAAIEVELDPSSAATSPAFARSGVGYGLKGRYFTGTAFDTFVGSRGDAEVNFTWGTTSPFTGVGASNYTVRWTGKVQTINEGSHGFSVNANAGKRLWVNNQLLIDSWNTSGNHSGTITLSGSTQYDITLEYVNRTGSSSVDLRWKRPGDSIFRLLPMSQLYPEPEFDTILDNTSGSGVAFNGAWTLSTSGVGQYGASYHHDGNTGKGTKSVVYTPTLPAAATYAVYVRHAAAANRSTATPVIVTHAGGTTTVNIDQTTGGGVWVPVGSYGFPAGTGGSVTISNTGTTGYVIADAVRFVKQ